MTIPTGFPSASRIASIFGSPGRAYLLLPIRTKGVPAGNPPVSLVNAPNLFCVLTPVGGLFGLPRTTSVAPASVGSCRTRTASPDSGSICTTPLYSPYWARRPTSSRRVSGSGDRAGGGVVSSAPSKSNPGNRGSVASLSGARVLKGSSPGVSSATAARSSSGVIKSNVACAGSSASPKRNG